MVSSDRFLQVKPAFSNKCIIHCVESLSAPQIEVGLLSQVLPHDAPSCFAHARSQIVPGQCHV